MDSKYETRQIRVLVKAFPQSSTKYEETVCCAGVTEDTQELLRLYPIRFRRLEPENRFTRFDQVEMAIAKDSDHRPESYRVAEGSIRLLEKGARLSEESKVRLWAPFIAPSLKQLHEENRETHRSLGIIKPDPGSLKFKYKPVEDDEDSDQNVASFLYEQQSLIEDPLTPLDKPKYSFHYHYTCAGHAHKHQIHDWEVQTAYRNYVRTYGSEARALQKLNENYQERIPANNLHFIVGTMKAHPSTFIVIGLLRSPLDPEQVLRQQELL